MAVAPPSPLRSSILDRLPTLRSVNPGREPQSGTVPPSQPKGPTAPAGQSVRTSPLVKPLDLQSLRILNEADVVRPAPVTQPRTTGTLPPTAETGGSAAPDSDLPANRDPLADIGESAPSSGPRESETAPRQRTAGGATGGAEDETANRLKEKLDALSFTGTGLSTRSTSSDRTEAGNDRLDRYLDQQRQRSVDIQSRLEQLNSEGDTAGSQEEKATLESEWGEILKFISEQSSRMDAEKAADNSARIQKEIDDIITRIKSNLTVVDDERFGKNRSSPSILSLL